MGIGSRLVADREGVLGGTAYPVAHSSAIPAGYVFSDMSVDVSTVGAHVVVSTLTYELGMSGTHYRQH